MLQAFASVLAERLAQPLKTGAMLSVTITVNEQLPLLLDVSLAEQLTVVTPLLKVEPDGGLHVTVLVPSQLSAAVGCV